MCITTLIHVARPTVKRAGSREQWRRQGQALEEDLRDPRPRRPRRQSPLRAPAAQSRQLGRQGPRAEVHAARGGRRRRTHAVCRQGPGMALPPECQLDRLAGIVPPPRKHRHRYHRVFAPNHQLRSAVTALAIGNIGKLRDAATGGYATGGCCDTHAKPRSHPPGAHPMTGSRSCRPMTTATSFKRRIDELPVIDVHSL